MIIRHRCRACGHKTDTRPGMVAHIKQTHGAKTLNGITVPPLDRENPVMPEPLPVESESLIHLLLDLPLGVHVGIDKAHNEVVIRVPRDVLERRLRTVVFA